MPPPNMDLVEDMYSKVLRALQGSTRGASIAVGEIISCLCAKLDGGLLGALIDWAINKVLTACVNLEGKALTIALRAEYLLRAGRVSYSSANKAWNLTNKCRFVPISPQASRASF
jgi:hypothetical protein